MKKQPRGLFRNFYAGYGMHLYCDSVGRSVFFVSYEFLKRVIQEQKSDNQRGIETCCSITVMERMFSACAAGMFSWAIIFPFDVVRSKTYAHTVLSSSQPVPSAFG